MKCHLFHSEYTLPANRDFDVIIWGATGFTGSLVAEYYLKHYGLNQSLKWAMAGRSQTKLEAVRKKLGNESIPLVLADSHDKDSLDAMTQQTRVICTTVGPYALYGNELVTSCVENSTHYCDLAGETQWIRRTIDRHHEQAQQTGARIVHCCGFDSIPSDMSVYYLQQQAKATKGEYAQHIKVRLKAAKGGLSGGTFASMNNVMAEAEKDPAIKKVLFNPYGLNPQGEMSGPDKADLTRVEYDDDIDAYIMPFIMAAINTRVVRRSHALIDYAYGENFRYEEAMISGRGFTGKLKGYAGLLALGAMMIGKPNSFYKNMLNRFFPKPGEGPSRKEREAGYWNFTVVGKFLDGTRLVARVTGDRDPGYASTCKMLGESAACLALDSDKTPAIGGVLTPSSAMGDALLNRLTRNAGLTFNLID
jgi:short subunit dehydrogenase-like uncharacterized protein